jgi:hypothetical protein
MTVLTVSELNRGYTNKLFKRIFCMLKRVYIFWARLCIYTGRLLSVWAKSTALRFTAAGAPLAATRIRILPMNQHA